MNRYVRPAGFSLALGVGVVTGAGCSSTGSSDALPPVRDGAVAIPLDGRVNIVDGARDALPPSPDVYGVLDRPPLPQDGRVDIVDSDNDVPGADVYGIWADGRVDIVDSAREALPPSPDAYGVFDRPPLPQDGRVDIVDSAREALPPSPDVYGVLDRPPLPQDGGLDGPAVDAADAADAIAAQDGADGGAGD
jgi:hypothetical protein